MGRYKEKETTSLSDMMPPPFIHTFEIEDTKTSKIGKGAGYTEKEARNNAWEDLKFGQEPKYKETPIDLPISSGGGGGGGGGGASLSFPELEALIGCIIIGTLLIVSVFASLDFLGRKTEDLIKRVYPAYETSTERVARVQAEKKQQKEQIFGSLNKWVIRQKLLDEISGRKNYDDWYQIWHNDYAITGKDIWVVGGITVITEGFRFRSVNFVFYSPDNNKSWEIKWRNNLSRETELFGTKKIEIIDKYRLAILLWGPSNTWWMLYTENGGKSWKIDEKWNPRKVKNL